MPTVLLVARGVLLLGLLATAPLLILRALVRRGRRGRRIAMSRNVVARRPLEDVAADLRRLDRQFALVPSGATLVRWRALWAAYDRVLMEAADQLDVPHRLPDMPVGVELDIERLRVASALEARGLAVRG